MKILYAGTITPNDSTLYRMWALQRLGHTPVPFNATEYEPKSPLVRKISFRLAAGPHVDRLNRDLLRIAEEQQVDAVWADKLLGMQPGTLRQLRQRGVVTASYMIDNAFGPRKDPGWRLYRKCLPLYDLHITQREVSLQEYRRQGVRDVMKIQTAYEPTIHYPPPPGWNEGDRERGVSFIGTPYDQRAQFLTRLWKEEGFPVIVSGAPMWNSALGPEAAAALYSGGELFRDAYREAIWRSRINLSFLTHSNQDEFVHKSFEIAACGGFLLAERSAGHTERFVEDEEAVFFSTYEECVAKIRRYLPDEQSRERIAAAGQRRASRSGYDNDRQVSLIVDRIQQIVRSRAEGRPPE
ncbi:MAG: hypothetical protein NVSMB3_12870 [Acidobacteriaceae bacterium]